MSGPLRKLSPLFSDSYKLWGILDDHTNGLNLIGRRHGRGRTDSFNSFNLLGVRVFRNLAGKLDEFLIVDDPKVAGFGIDKEKGIRLEFDRVVKGRFGAAFHVDGGRFLSGHFFGYEIGNAQGKHKGKFLIGFYQGLGSGVSVEEFLRSDTCQFRFAGTVAGQELVGHAGLAKLGPEVVENKGVIGPEFERGRGVGRGDGGQAAPVGPVAKPGDMGWNVIGIGSDIHQFHFIMAVLIHMAALM